MSTGDMEDGSFGDGSSSTAESSEEEDVARMKEEEEEEEASEHGGVATERRKETEVWQRRMDGCADAAKADPQGEVGGAEVCQLEVDSAGGAEEKKELKKQVAEHPQNMIMAARSRRQMHAKRHGAEAQEEEERLQEESQKKEARAMALEVHRLVKSAERLLAFRRREVWARSVSRQEGRSKEGPRLRSRSARRKTNKKKVQECNGREGKEEVEACLEGRGKRLKKQRVAVPEREGGGKTEVEKIFRPGESRAG